MIGIQCTCISKEHNMKKLLTLFLCAGMLVSCSSSESTSFSSEEGSSDNQSLSSEELPLSSDETPSPTSEEEKDQNLISGSFKIENGIYRSLEAASIYKLDEQFNDGTFSFAFKREDSFSENGIKIVQDDNNYYFIGVNIVGKFVINKVVEGRTSSLYSEKLNRDYSKIYSRFALYFNHSDKNIDVYLSDYLLTSLKDDEILDNSSIYLVANGINTSFKEIEINKDRNIFIEDFDYYHTASGVFIEDDEGFVSKSNNSILVNDSITFSNGSFEATMQLSGLNKDNGIIFGLDSNGTSAFWEGSGIEYYFFFVSYAGLAYLGKAVQGGWVVCGTKDIPNYSNTETYKLKVSRYEDTIYCFINDLLYIVYTDASPLTGTGFGLRAGGVNVAYSSIHISRVNDEEGDIDNYELGSGDIVAYEGLVKTISSKTIGVVKGSNMYKGTLTTSFIPGCASEAGLIFRATVPEGNYYEEENGLSYYFLYIENGVVSFTRYENGNIKKETKRYFPYGIYISYEAKIIMDDNDIYCYLNGRLVMHYTDDNPLQGTGYGFKSRAADLVVAPFIEKPLEEKQTNQYLIFGHSYTDFWKTYKEDFTEFSDIYNIGIGGAITYDWGINGFQKEVIAYEPEYGIYWNGINDINRNIPNATIGENVRNMAIGIHEALPNFKLILIGVCRCPVDSHRRNDITAVNNYYKQIADELDYVIYIDVELLYCNGSGVEVSSYFTDGLHPTHQAYLMCVDKIMDVIGG